MTILVSAHYMDEAEYCHRVGMMRAGQLLALDTPQALKTAYLPGPVYEIFAEPLLAGLEALAQAPGVRRVSLAGNHLRALLHNGGREAALRQALKAAGVTVSGLQRSQPTLEDVFLSLAKG